MRKRVFHKNKAVGNANTTKEQKKENLERKKMKNIPHPGDFHR